MAQLVIDLWTLRHRIYRHVADIGAVPCRAEITSWVGGRVDAADALLRELHDRHLLVLGDDGEVAMALPFATTDTGHRVVAGGRSWWANCAWDSLAVPIALGLDDARIEARWLDTDEPVDLGLAGGALVGSGVDGFVHYAVAASRWWDDIAET